MRVLLVFPPQWTAAQPYFGLTSLNGQLRRAGHQVILRDLNLELLEHALGTEGLRAAYQRLVSEARLLTSEIGLRALAGDAEHLSLAERRLQGLERYHDRWGQQLDALCEQAELVAPALRDPAQYYEPSRYLAAAGAMDAALELYSISSYPSALRWNDFRHPTCPLNLGPLKELCADRRLNPFVRFYERKLLGLIEAEAGMIALSVNSFSQVVPALTLAAMLREELAALPAARRPHLTLGGNFFSRLRESLVGKPGFFAAFTDSLCIGEGERTIVELAAAVERGEEGALGEVPNLLYLGDGGRVESSPTAPNYRMEEMAFQELEGLPLDRYLAPERVVCLRASKGCYWGQCSFCDSHHGLEQDSVEVERVIAEMRHLRDRHGVRHFEFVDQCISPASLSTLADGLLAAGLGVRWFCNARTEPGFTPELLERVHRAGNTMIMWGVESASPRLLKLMRKGVHVERRLDILRASSAAGIWNFAYVFFGFPTETEAEAQATIDLIRHHTDIIHAYGRSVFTLGKHSPLMKDPAQVGILCVVEDTEDLSTNLTYEVASGLRADDLAKVSARCLAQCQEAYGGDPLWMALRSREALHLYLAHHGKQFVQDYRFNESPAGQAAEFIF